MSRINRFFSTLLGFRQTKKRGSRQGLRLSLEQLEDRTLPSAVIHVANVDGYVADANQDGAFDTVNTTGTSVQASSIPGSGSSTDQSCAAGAYYNYSTSYGGNLPLGQEFKPTLSSLSFVDLVIADAGSDIGPGANFLVKIHSGSITGTVLGTSATVFVADNTNITGTSNYTHFTFSSPISLTAASTYVLEVVQTGSIVPGNSNFMLTADNPNGANQYTPGRGIISGIPVTTNLDFLFKEGTTGQQGVTERGVMEFNTAGITSSSTITSATLSGTIGTLQATPAAGVAAAFYAYTGDGQITIADATASAVQVGTITNPALGAFSINLDPNALQTLVQSPSYNGYIGIMVRLTSGQRFFLNSNESTAAGPKPTLQIVYDTSNRPPTATNDSYRISGTQLVVAAPGVIGNDSDPDGDPLSASLVTGPSYGSLSLAPDGSFTYTPFAGTFTSNDSFIYKVSDGNAFSNFAKVTVQLNHAPVAYSFSTSTTVNVPLNMAAPGILGNDYDPDGDRLTAVLVTGPSHGALTLNSNGSFNYIPNQDYTGSDSFTYQASDGSLNSNTATITLVVNTPPVAQDDGFSTNQGSTLNVSAPGVLLNDSDANGDRLIPYRVAGPAHGTLSLNSTGSFTYTPNAGYYGNDTFTYKVSDGYTFSNVATVTIAVNRLNHPPTAVNDSFTLNQSATLSIQRPGVLSNDTDPDADSLTAVMASSPSHGTLALNSDGSFAYTPNAGYFGTDSFTYQASDGSLTSNIATVNLTINTTDHAPVANADAYSVNQDAALTVPAAGVLTNDTDADGDPLTVSLAGGPTHGSLTLNPDGSFVYTPNAGYTGPDSFSYRVSDGILTSNVATVAITINRVDHAPVAVNDAYTINEDQTLTVAPVAGVTSLVMQSQAGDYIGQGQNYTYSSSTGLFSATRNFNNGVSFAYQDTLNANAWWYLDFAAPANAFLAPGSYLNATRYPFQSSSAPGLNISGEGRGSNTLTGQFTVVQAVYGANNQISRFDATFVQHSEGFTPALTGEIKYNYSTAPSGLLTNDSDPDGDPLAAVLVSGPAHGTVTFNADGTFIYKPSANFNGTDSFSYKANDGTLDSNVATVSITVNAVNDAPTFTKGTNQTIVEGAGAQTVAVGLPQFPPGRLTRRGRV